MSKERWAAISSVVSVLSVCLVVATINQENAAGNPRLVGLHSVASSQGAHASHRQLAAQAAAGPPAVPAAAMKTRTQMVVDQAPERRSPLPCPFSCFIAPRRVPSHLPPTPPLPSSPPLISPHLPPSRCSALTINSLLAIFCCRRSTLSQDMGRASSAAATLSLATTCRRTAGSASLRPRTRLKPSRSRASRPARTTKSAWPTRTIRRRQPAS
jgi:hypothetical protein